MARRVTTSLFANVTDQGTAALETCLCGPCNTSKAISELQLQDDVTSQRVDVTENDAMECQGCGAVLIASRPFKKE